MSGFRRSIWGDNFPGPHLNAEKFVNKTPLVLNWLSLVEYLYSLGPSEPRIHGRYWDAAYIAEDTYRHASSNL